MTTPLHLFGFSDASAYAVYPLMGLGLLLPIYMVWGGWPPAGDRQHIRLLWFVALPTTAVLALWLAGGVAYSLLGWLLWGDAGHSFGRSMAGVVATTVSAILFARLTTGRVTRRYLRLNAWGAGLCVFLFGAMRFIHFAEGIDGWSARGAAENQFAYLMKGSELLPAHLPRRLVDETTPELAATGGKAFAMYVGDKRVSEIRVMPYYRWWWSVGYSRSSSLGLELSTEERLRKFNEHMEKIRARKPRP